MIRGLAVSQNFPPPPVPCGSARRPADYEALDLSTMQIRSMGAAEGFTSPNVRHIMADREGRVWVSTRDGLLCKLPGLGSIRLYLSVPSPVNDPIEVFHTTMMDANGQVWAAGSRGACAHSAKGTWTRFTERDGLKSNVVAHLAEDPDGSLWIGYYDAFGLTLADVSARPTKAGTIHHREWPAFRQIDLPGLRFPRLAVGGTDHGVDVFDHTRWRHYGRSDGLIWDDCNSNAFLADETVPSGSGPAAGFRASARFVARPSVPPPVVFTSVKFGEVKRCVDPRRSSSGSRMRPPLCRSDSRR